MARLDRPDEAITILKTLAKDKGERMAAKAALELATIDLEHDRAGAALETLEQAMRRFPKSSLSLALQFRSAEALRKLNRLPEAQARFLRVADADPDDPWADDALDRAAQCALDRDDPATARRLASTFATRFPKSPLRSEVRLIEARAATAEGKFEESAKILESLLVADERNAKSTSGKENPAFLQTVRYELALAYRALGRNDQSEATLSRLVKDASGAVAIDAQFLLGQAYVEAGRYAQAVAPLEKYLAANKQGDVADHALAHLTVAQLELGQPENARKTLARLATQFPKSKALAPTRLRLAEADLAVHHPDQAAELFRQVADAGVTRKTDNANTLDEKNAAELRIRALTGLGRALAEQGKAAEAASTFATLLKLAPGDRLAPEIALAQGARTRIGWSTRRRSRGLRQHWQTLC